jgi:hypothetical protein
VTHAAPTNDHRTFGSMQAPEPGDATLAQAAVVRFADGQHATGTRRVQEREHVRATAGTRDTQKKLIYRTISPGNDRTYPRLPLQNLHGKEGVDGSSPSEGFRKGQQMALFVASACNVLSFSRPQPVPRTRSPTLREASGLGLNRSLRTRRSHSINGRCSAPMRPIDPVVLGGTARELSIWRPAKISRPAPRQTRLIRTLRSGK